MPGPWQIILIVALILLLFGAGRLPRIMGDIAQGIKSFKKGMKDSDSENGESNDSQPPAPREIEQSSQISEEGKSGHKQENKNH